MNCSSTRNTFLNKHDFTTPCIEENSLILCTVYYGIFYQLTFFSNEYMLLGILHCSVFLTHTLTNIVEETAI